jgi:transposase
MIKAHKIRLHPTPEQANYFARAAGTSRFVWNWALAEWDRQYQADEKPTAFKLKKQFNEIRRELFPWTWEVTKNASDQPILDLGDHRLWVPKLGWVNMAENLRFKGKVTGARITKTADWWFVSLTVELPETLPAKRPAAVGIDVGLNRLATLSTGEGYENQAFLKTALKKLRQANKRLHRRKRGSQRREQARREARPPAVSHHLSERGCAPQVDDQTGRLLWHHWHRRPQPQGAPQESALVSFVLRRRAGQALEPARREGRAARGTADQGGALLPLQ